MSRRLTTRERADRRMGGDELASHLVALARQCGWLAVHFRPAFERGKWRTPFDGDAGFPDVTVARAGELHMWECKRQLEKVPADQQAWLDVLVAAGAEARVVRPSDLEWCTSILTARPRRVMAGRPDTG